MDVRAACRNHMTLSSILLLHRLGEVLLHHIEVVAGKKFSIRQMSDAILESGNTGKFLDMAVPFFDFLVANRPIHRKAISGRAFKVKVGPALYLSRPK